MRGFQKFHDYSSETINKRHDVAARKDTLREYISGEIKRHGLITRDIRQFDPTITANAVTGMRFQDRSCASVERLETIARGLGWSDRFLESMECAA